MAKQLASVVDLAVALALLLLVIGTWLAVAH
jgi:hypothetical protein